jgi:integrase
MFDLKAGVWVKPSAHTKQRKAHRVPPSAPAVQLVTSLRATANAVAATTGTALSPYMFPGRNGQPITDIKRTWLSVCRAAGLTKPMEKPRRTDRW